MLQIHLNRAIQSITASLSNSCLVCQLLTKGSEYLDISPKPVFGLAAPPQLPALVSKHERANESPSNSLLRVKGY